MKEMRLMFVALFLAATVLAAGQAAFERDVADATKDEGIKASSLVVPTDANGKVPPIPEYEFFSFLDQQTGQWRRTGKQ